MAKKARGEAAEGQGAAMKIKKGDHVVVIAGRDAAARARSSWPTPSGSGSWSRAST